MFPTAPLSRLHDLGTSSPLLGTRFLVLVFLDRSNDPFGPPLRAVRIGSDENVAAFSAAVKGERERPWSMHYHIWNVARVAPGLDRRPRTSRQPR